MSLFDSIGFWLKGVPYLWIEGTSYKDCYRYYFISGDMVVYDKEGRMLKLGWIQKGNYCVFPIVDCRYDFIRNYFLVYNGSDIEGVPKVDGEEVDEVWYSPVNNHIVNIIDLNHRSYLWGSILTADFADKEGPVAKIRYYDKEFRNIGQIYHQYFLTEKELSVIHRKAQTQSSDDSIRYISNDEEKIALVYDMIIGRIKNHPVLSHDKVYKQSWFTPRLKTQK